MLKAEGRDTGGKGNAAAEITATPRACRRRAPRCVVTTDLHITGKVAQFGRGIIGDVSKKLMAQFATNLNTMLDEQPSRRRRGSTATATAGARGEPPATGASRRRGDRPTRRRPRARSAATRRAPAARRPPSAPKVRKIDGPASEPVDLAGVAGPAILKRLVPSSSACCSCCSSLRRRR